MGRGCETDRRTDWLTDIDLDKIDEIFHFDIFQSNVRLLTKPLAKLQVHQSKKTWSNVEHTNKKRLS